MLMRKVLIAIASCFLITAVSDAQPTLTAATTNPVESLSPAYNERVLDAGAGISPGPAGAGVHWDHSRLLVLQYSRSGTYTSCVANPLCGKYPGSTLMYSDGSPNTKTFFIANANKLAINAFEADNTDYTYSDPQDVLHFPFTFGNSYVDSFTSKATNLAFVTRRGTAAVTADGYGTLITPGGTYPNSLQVKTVLSYQDSFYANSRISVGVITIYDWYSTSLRDYVFRLHKSVLNGIVGPDIVTWRQQSPTAIHAAVTQPLAITISPSPARDILYVKNTSATPCSYQLSDVSGRVVATGKASGDVEVNVSTLARGMYFFKATGGGHLFATKVLLE